MNLNMLGGIFELDAKYAMTLAMIFMCHLYFGALPVILPLITCYFFVQFWLDKIYITKWARKPPHYHANMHTKMMKILPWCTILHCAFSMWAYGEPEIWPKGVETKVENGETTYYTENRSLYDRLFNENSLPFFVLMFVLLFVYFVDLILEEFIMRIFFKVDKMVDMNQRTYTKNKNTMARFSQISYDPELNEEYAKILLAMQDVAVIKKGYLLDAEINADTKVVEKPRKSKESSKKKKNR